MSFTTVLHPYTPFFPPGPAETKAYRNRNNPFNRDEPPQKPDWLMIFMGILFVLTLFLLWIVDIPRLLN
ncbi:hypothetical protein [Spirosoma sp. KNUC1025]|uniref:hypothetical protein n=1 Tax=Spirosoma sp. KNUC1025 TaxID=2894082 RepID=UPI003866DCDA|nr:hypothetical protein LN737_16055 [Spirosoma sp. KNUC1025]